MKLSQLQEILKEYQDKFGDIDIRLFDAEMDCDRDLTYTNITATSHDEDNPLRIDYITIWC